VLLIEWVSKGKDFLFLGARQFSIVAIMAWTPLLLQRSAADFPGISDLRTAYQPWIGGGNLEL
jgi:hypothetical protein